MSERPVRGVWRLAPLALAGMVALYALVVLAGWMLRRADWVQLAPDVVPMQFNTALLFIACAGALAALSLGLARLAAGIGLMSMLLALLTLSQEIFHLGWGLDTLLVDPVVTTQTPYPGRMSPSTATGFLLLGFGIFTAAASRRLRLAAAAVCVLLLLLGAGGLAGALTGETQAYAFYRFTPMALQTAVLFVLSGAALLLTLHPWPAWTDSLADWLPAAVFAFGFMALVFGWQSLAATQAEQAARLNRAVLDDISSALRERVRVAGDSLDRMGKRGELYPAVQRRALWEADARLFLRDFPELRSVDWVRPDGAIAWHVGGPPASGLGGGADVHASARIASLEAARFSGRLSMTSPLDIGGGARGFLINAPVYDGARLFGFVSASVAYEDLFRNTLRGADAQFRIAIKDGDELLFLRETEAAGRLGTTEKTAVLVFPGTRWTVSVTPDVSLSPSAAMLALGFAAGLALVALLALTVRFVLLARLHAGVAVANLDALRREADRREGVEAQRRAAEEQIVSVLESITDSFYLLDRNWNFVYANRSAAQVLERSADELLGGNVWRLFPEARDTELFLHYHRAVDTNQPQHFEFRYEPLKAWFEVHAHPSPRGLAVYFRDITVQRAAGEQLRLLQTAVSRLNDIVLITEAEPIDEPGPRIVYVNEAFERRTGYTRAEVLGKTPRILQGEGTDRAALDRIRHALERWQPVREELLNYTKGGVPFWLELDIVPIANESGWFTHWVAVERDITDRIGSQQALQESEQRYRQLFQFCPLPMWIYDPGSLRFLAVNSAAVRRYGYSEAEFLSMSIRDIRPPEDVEAVTAAARRAEPGGVDLGLWRHVRKDGGLMHVRVFTNQVVFGDGPAHLALVEDVTEQVEAEALLRHRQALLRIAGQVGQMGGWSLDLPDYALSWSEEIHTLLDWPIGQAPSLDDALNLYPAEWRDKISAALEACIRDGTPFDLRLEIVSAKGRRFWARAVGEPERAADGSIRRVHGAFQNISDQLETEFALRDTTERLSRILSSITDAFFALDRDWRFTYLNPRAELLLNRNAGELIGRNVWEEFPEAVGSTFDLQYRKAVAQNEPVQFEEYYPPLDAWFQVSAYPFDDGLSVYFQDVSARHNAQESLRLQAQIIDQLRDSVATTALDGRILTWNKGAERLYGYSAEEIIGQPASIVYDDPGFREREMIPRLRADGAYEGEVVMRHRSGRRIDVQVSIATIFDGAGAPAGYVAYSMDIAPRKRADAALREALESARRQAAQLEGLHRVSLAISSLDKLDRTLQLVADEARNLVPCHQSVISVTVDQDWSQAISALSLSDKYAQYRDYEGLPDGAGIYSLVCRENKALRLTQAELESHPAWRGFGKEGKRHPPMRGWLAVPLLDRAGHNIGLLQLSDRMEAEFSDQDQAVLEQLAHLAALAIEGSRLFQRVRESEERYRVLIEEAPDAIYLQRGNRFAYLNPAAARLFGVARAQELIGRSVLDFVHPEERGVVRNRIASLAKGARLLPVVERRMLKADGSEFPAEVTAVALQVEGTPGAQVFVRDLSERMVARRALQERERFFGLSLEMFCIAGFDGRFKQVNAAFTRVLGYSEAELLATPFLGFVVSDDVERTTGAAKQLALGGRVVDFQNRYVCKDGTIKWLEWNATSVLEEEQIFAVARDVTERKLAQNTLQKALEALESSNRDLQEFAFVASHDLQEPLRKIQTFSDRLINRHAVALGGEVQQYLDRIRSAAGRMQTLVEDLLQYSRLGRNARAFTLVPLASVVTDVLSDLEGAIERSGARVDVAALPEVEGDRTQLRQLFMNLVANALKFTRDGVPPRVSIGCEIVQGGLGQMAEVTVRDNGIGFEPQYAEQIFQPFKRLNTQEAFAGSGIGLAIVRKIVDRHNGSVQAEGVPGEGASFRVRLPLRQHGVAIPGASDGAIR
jgi:PAS domain S-box-containing protein